MGYCGEHGVPHSIFIGRVPEPGEPYWLAEDRAKTMAWMLEKSAVCSRCGTADWEWKADPRAYEPAVDQCPGCFILARAEEGRRAEAQQPGQSVKLVPKAVAAAMRHAPRPGRPTRRRRERAEP